MTWDGEPEEKANVFGLHKAVQNSFSNSKTDIHHIPDSTNRFFTFTPAVQGERRVHGK
jgi:hypothetical protein